MTVAVVCYDAGAAQLIASLIKHHPDACRWHLFSVPGAPAWQIAANEKLENLLENVDAINDLDAYLDSLGIDAMLYGTGWQRQLQKPFFVWAKTHGVVTAAILDHWTLYRERFGYPDAQWRDNLPDYTLAHDEHSMALAESFGLSRVLGLKNYALEETMAHFEEAAKTHPVRNRLLFLSEPTAKVAQARFNDAYHWGFTEKEAFASILEHFDAFGTDELKVRLHPSDTVKTYEALAAAFPALKITIETAASRPLLHSLLEAKIVIGFDTVALYDAYLIGKSALSFLPTEKRTCALPLPPANCLRDLDDLDIGALTHADAEKPAFGITFASLLQQLKERA